MSGCFVAEVSAFSARGPDTEMTMDINENTVLVFENVDLNVCGGYNNTTGYITNCCKPFLDNKRTGFVVPHFDCDYIFAVGEDELLCTVFRAAVSRPCWKSTHSSIGNFWLKLK